MSDKKYSGLGLKLSEESVDDAVDLEDVLDVLGELEDRASGAPGIFATPSLEAKERAAKAAAKPASVVSLAKPADGALPTSDSAKTPEFRWFDELLAKNSYRFIDQGIVNAYKGLLLSGEFHVVVGNRTLLNTPGGTFVVYTNFARIIYGDQEFVRVLSDQPGGAEPFTLTRSQCDSLVKAAKYEDTLHASLDRAFAESRKSGRYPLVELLLAEYRRCTGQRVLDEISAEQKRLHLEQVRLAEIETERDAAHKKFEEKRVALEAWEKEFYDRIRRLALKESSQAAAVGCLQARLDAAHKLLLTVKTAEDLEVAKYVAGEADECLTA